MALNYLIEHANLKPLWGFYNLILLPFFHGGNVGMSEYIRWRRTRHDETSNVYFCEELPTHRHFIPCEGIYKIINTGSHLICSECKT